MGVRKKSRSVIYDFDNTIFNSPDREHGELLYLEATGQMFPFQGWWGRKESLMPPVVPEQPTAEWYISATVDAYRQDYVDDDCEVILMTGRPYKNRRRIIDILDFNDLKFHDYYFRGMPGQKGRDTLEIKAGIIEEKIIHGGLKTLEIWEDRPDHLSGFFNLSKRWKSQCSSHLEKIILHDVKTGENHQI